jgi:hypothetical protein
VHSLLARFVRPCTEQEIQQLEDLVCGREALIACLESLLDTGDACDTGKFPLFSELSMIAWLVRRRLFELLADHYFTNEGLEQMRQEAARRMAELRAQVN